MSNEFPPQDLNARRRFLFHKVFLLKEYYTVAKDALEKGLAKGISNGGGPLDRYTTYLASYSKMHDIPKAIARRSDVFKLLYKGATDKRRDSATTTKRLQCLIDMGRIGMFEAFEYRYQ